MCSENMFKSTNSTCIYTDGSKASSVVGYAYVWGDRCVFNKIQTYASSYTAELLPIYEALKNTVHCPSENVKIVTDSRSYIQEIIGYNCVNAIVRLIQ